MKFGISVLRLLLISVSHLIYLYICYVMDDNDRSDIFIHCSKIWLIHSSYIVVHDDVIKWNHYPLLTLCAGNSSVTGEFPAQRPVTRSFNVFFDLRLNKRLSKQSSGW